MRVLLVSTYELGHQPLHVASPAAALLAAGHDVRAIDLSVDPWDPNLAAWAEGVAISVPMHTAMRLGVQVARGLRAARPEVPICFYGLYAQMGRSRSLSDVVDCAIAGEYEPALLRWAAGDATPSEGVQLGHTHWNLPARHLLPPLDRYARLAVDGELRLAGYVEATHGCAHRCRHCPVPVVYDGRIRTVGEEAVVADAAQLVAAGARHLTFGDPDFLNGAHHARRVIAAVHHHFPQLTFDCTAKVEHLLAHPDLWPELAGAGCLLVVSAFETVDDATLVRLDKGHTRADAARAVALLRASGIEIRPSWLPFTPWTTPRTLVDLFEFVAANDLVGNVDPIQYTIRLLLPDGSLLLDEPSLAPHLDGYDAEGLSYRWKSPDPDVDRLQRELAREVEAAVSAGWPPGETFESLRELVHRAAGLAPAPPPAGVPADRPRLTEPWFCCAEPTSGQFGLAAPGPEFVTAAPPRAM